MGLTTRTLPAISNGISRQPAILRSPDQTEAELNTWGQIATGLGRRPPAEHIEALSGLDLSTAYVHHINRDTQERYVVIIDAGLLRVFDLASGAEKTVNAPGGLGYLSAPGSGYRAVTVADYTFIVNSEVAAGLAAVGADETAQPDYYRWAGGTNSHREVTGGSVILAGAAYQYAPNVAAGALTGSVQSFDKLPATPSVGDTYEVLGAAETAFVSYYVRWDGSVWNETVRPGIANGFNAATMPHALVREGDGTFTFAPFSWKPRRVGDNNTNPYPPFVGRHIRDVFFYQNRLGFLVDESVVFSAAGDYGDFWRRTVLDYIASDTVSVAASTTDVAILDFAVPFVDGMVIFSGQRQFSLTNGEAGLSAESVSIQPITGYLMTPNVRPAPLGNQVYFASDHNGYVALQEYTRLDGADSTDAADVSAHVPGLIPQGVSQVIAAADMDAVFIIVRNAETVEQRRRMYAYQFFWDADKKIQSAWREWDFADGEPISGAYVDGELWLVMKRPEGYTLERLPLSPGASSPGQNRLLYLDRQLSQAGTYDPVTDTTTYTLPYTPDPDRFRIVRGGASPTPESVVSPTVYEFIGDTVTVPGDETAVPVSMGHTFLSYVEISQQFPTDWQGRHVTTGRLQLHTFTVVYEDTAYFRAEVNPYGKDAAGLGTVTPHIVDFTGRLVGSASLVIGEPAYHSGSFTFAVAGNAKDSTIMLSNDSPFAATWVSAEWEGLFFSRAL